MIIVDDRTKEWKYYDCTPEDTDGKYEGLRYAIFKGNRFDDNDDTYRRIAKTTDGGKEAEANARRICMAVNHSPTLAKALLHLLEHTHSDNVQDWALINDACNIANQILNKEG